MLTFKRWIKITKYLTAVLFFLILFIVFISIITKQIQPEQKIVKINDKAKAESIDIWRLSKDGTKRYRLKASSMQRTKEDTVILNNAELWYFQVKKPTVYLKSDVAKVYKDNDVYAFGHVYLKREDLQLHTNSVRWTDRLKRVEGKEAFKGSSKKSSFSGRSFIYYLSKDKLVAFGVDIWIK